MSTNHQGFPHLSESATAEITIGAVIFIFFLFIFALFSILRAKGCWGAIPAFGGNRLGDIYEASADVRRRGLDASDIKAISSLVYRPEDFKEGLECSVCLSELLSGEEARLLPLCRHVFHVKCIDMWFQSHSSCPLCRSAVLASSDTVKTAKEGRDGSTDVNSEMTQDNSVVSVTVLNDEAGESSNSVVEEIRGPATTRLEYVRRFLRGVGAPGMRSGLDVEQGLSSVPKIPACF